MSLHSIRSKIWVCVGVAFIGFLLATLSTLNANTKLSSNLTMLRDLNFPLALKGSEVLSLFKKQTKLYEDAFMLGEKDAIRAGNELAKDILALLEQMSTIEAQQNGNTTNLRDLIEHYTNYAEMAKITYERAIAGGDITVLQKDIQQTGQLQTELLANFEKQYKIAITHVESTIDEGKRDALHNTYFHSALFVVVLLLSVLIITYVANRLLIMPLQRIQEMVKALAAGKLSLHGQLRSHPKDEIGQLAVAMHDLALHLTAMVTRVTTTSEELAAVSHNLLDTSSRVNTAAELQALGVNKTSAAVTHIIGSVKDVGQGVEILTVSAADSSSSILQMAATFDEVALSADNLFQSVEEVNSAIYEMTASLKQVAGSATNLKVESDITTNSVAHMDGSIALIEQKARETALITESVRNDAEIGREAVSATISGIDNIKRAAGIVSAAIQSLSEKTTSIGDILTVISDITEQTGLLALNAAIIASQAGIHGKGFAVVASEIRELADRTALSTNEIEEVIRGVQTETCRVIEAMSAAGMSISDGEDLSAKSGVALENIAAGVLKAAQQMETISQATMEQGNESRVIRSAMEKVSSMISHIASSTAEQQKGGEQILSAAEQMRFLTSKVQSSTRDQSLTGKVIAQSTESINEMISRIKHACDEQRVESQGIIGTVAEFKETTQVTLGSTKVLNEAVNRLSAQISVLQEEMGNFSLVEGGTQPD